MLREAVYRVLQLQGAGNQLARPPELFELWWIVLQHFLWSLTQGITGCGGAFLLLSSQPPPPPPLCLSKGENFNHCFFCTKGGSWYGVCLLSLDTYVAQRISESQAWVGERGKAYVYGGSSGSELVVVPHCHLCQRMRVGKKLTGLALLWKYCMVLTVRLWYIQMEGAATLHSEFLLVPMLVVRLLDEKSLL